MKATKVLGVALGVLMVAALFAGAGAAAATEGANGYVDQMIGDIYIYALYNKSPLENVDILNATWTSSKDGSTASFVLDSATSDWTNGPCYYIPGTIESEGDYYYIKGLKKFHINLKWPSAEVVGDAEKKGKYYSLIGSTTSNDKNLTFEAKFQTPFTEVPSELNINITSGLMFTNPDKTLTSSVVEGNPGNSSIDENGVITWKNVIPEESVKKMDLGTWTVQTFVDTTFYKPTSKYCISPIFASTAPSVILGKEYYFTLVEEDTAMSLTSLSDEVLQGGYATVVLTAPTGSYLVVLENGIIPAGQPNVHFEGILSTYSAAYINVGSDGVQKFVVQANSSNDIKVKLYESLGDLKKQISIKVTPGDITAVIADDAYTVYIGDEFEVSGTNDLGGKVYFYVKGTNFGLIQLKESNENLSASGKVWTKTIDTELFVSDQNSNKRPDAGTYTLYVVKFTGDTPVSSLDVDASNVEAYTTISVSLIQPFITASAPAVVVQNDKLVIDGIAEGNPSSVYLYIFGQNYFGATDITVLDDGTFTFSWKIPTDLATGQYYAVIQHPMYNKKFNIQPIKNGNIDGTMGADIKINKSYNPSNDYATWSVLFNTADRQSSNAAKALVDAIASEDIDDMQTQLSFIVAAPSSVVSPIPSQVTKGQDLTISGTTKGHANDMVSVELKSTAFAALSKEAVGSAAFATLTTRIGDDGVWSVTFDTSDMNADDYTVSIAVADLATENAQVKIVEGAQPTQQPTGQPTVVPTTQPTTTPATPGFGALAALVGLGAVAVLLLRRE